MPFLFHALLYMFCKYKDIFGKPGQGAHAYRIFNIAMVDVILTILAAILIQRFIPTYSILFIVSVLFLFGLFFHRLFCVRTTIDKLLF